MAAPARRPYRAAMAHAAPTGALMTAEEFERLASGDGYRDELSRGRLIREPNPGAVHGRVQLRLGGRLERHVAEHELGYVTAESGYILERHPDTVRGPDLAFVSRERYGDALPSRWPEFAPDLVVEILSPSDRFSGVAEKVAQYVGAGTRLAWVIDPAERTAVVHRRTGDVRVLTEAEALDGEDVLPGFRCALAEILDPA